MADFQPQPDGSAQISLNQGESAGLKALAGQHLPFLKKAARWFGADVAPEIKDAADFLETLAGIAPEGSAVAASAPQVQMLRGLLSAHIPDFQQVLAVVESPVVRSLLTLAANLP